ncbi:hypothetical protein AVEN_186161-1 [Araneus ventricosus]|uniref:Uncharacterized protein n=1 Tax=Araneus ventricosus TaxID=182803 RepID=A0A4Y2GGK4_ARAVE|nr:hypothetical protein AVEN_186161-1 [Araneus ventricosus]
MTNGSSCTSFPTTIRGMYRSPEAKGEVLLHDEKIVQFERHRLARSLFGLGRIGFQFLAEFIEGNFTRLKEMHLGIFRHTSLEIDHVKELTVQFCIVW